MQFYWENSPFCSGFTAVEEIHLITNITVKVEMGSARHLLPYLSYLAYFIRFGMGALFKHKLALHPNFKYGPVGSSVIQVLIQ